MPSPDAEQHLKLVKLAATHAQQIGKLAADERTAYTELREQFLAEAGE